MEVPAQYYILPSDPSLRCLDPLGICTEDDPSVWMVIRTSIQSFRNRLSPPASLHTLTQLIEDLSYSIHMDGHINTKFLSKNILDRYPDIRSSDGLSLLNSILDSALLLPSLFETHRIPYLNERNSILPLLPSQIKCLLAHQILNTLKPPKGNDWGCTFTCWYSEPQPLENAVSGYLTYLFDVFTPPINIISRTTYTFYSLPSSGVPQTLTDWTSDLKTRIFSDLSIEPVSSASVPFPHETVKCTLVASNSSPGFGCSCTQEELVTASCPSLLPMGALLISPPVPDDAVIMVHTHGPLFQWKGKGRQARATGKFATTDHTFLFLDASELDGLVSSDSAALADLDLKYFYRDLHKAYTGFKALVGHGIKEVVSPIWGAGAFGADPIIKTFILAAASAGANIALRLLVDEGEGYTVHDSGETLKLIEMLRGLKESCYETTIEGVIEKLTSDEALRCESGFEVLQLF